MHDDHAAPRFDGHVCVIDVGSPANLGWAMEGPAPRAGRDLEGCIAALAEALARGPVALGFEAPLFVPYRDDPRRLSAARDGECLPGLWNRPFSAGAGAAVLVTALGVVPYVLRRLRAAAPGARVTLDWSAPPAGPGALLAFEAFVTAQDGARADRHVADARLAARSLLAALRRGRVETAVAGEPCLSLVGAALLRAGWTADPAVLATPCLVVRPDPAAAAAAA